MSERLKEAVRVYCDSAPIVSTVDAKTGIRMLEALAGNVEYKRKGERSIDDQLAEAAGWIIETANSKARVDEFRLTALRGAADMARQCLEAGKVSECTNSRKLDRLDVVKAKSCSSKTWKSGGAIVSVVTTADANLDANEPWIASCETHSEMIACSTKRLAESAARNRDWCSGCNNKEITK